MNESLLAESFATAVIGVDTLWGGNVLSASGTGRFIADCWFSDQPLPAAYTHPAAARVRAAGGVSGGRDKDAIDEYLRAIDIPSAIADIRCAAADAPVYRRRYLEGQADCFEVMWDLALEMLGRGPVVPFDRSVVAATGQAPEPSDPRLRQEQLARALAAAGRMEAAGGGEVLARAVDAWRAERMVAADSVPALAAIRISELDRLTAFRLMPFLPADLAAVPRANIEFLPIQDAWFSGSMNYIGRARTNTGEPKYEATYEINASLQISIPEFEQLIAHEVVPGHVTTFAFLQNIYARGRVGFEASVLTINTRAATLFEGIANNAILIAHGVTEAADLDDPDAQIGLLLAQLQDEAKNHAAWLTWNEGRTESEVSSILRRDFLVSEERASKLAGAWGRHPLLGRMCLPAYRAGTEVVARLRRAHPPSAVLPALYGCQGLVDIVTVQQMLAKDVEAGVEERHVRR